MSQIVEMVSTDLAVSAVGEAVKSERTQEGAVAQGSAQGPDLLRETAYAVRQRLYQLLTYSHTRPSKGEADESAKAETQRVE